MCVYSACCYTADSDLCSLKVIAYWRKVDDYKQKRGEELVNVISRERQRFAPVTKVCRQLGIECIKTPERILNMQGLVLEDLFKAAESRALYFGTEFAEAGWEDWKKLMLAEEVRANKLTVQQRSELTHSKKKAHDKPWRSQADRKPYEKQARKESTNKRWTPRAAPAASGATCPNHPDSNHTAAECRAADKDKNCYRFLAEGKCSYTGECRFAHNEAARTPEAIEKAKQRLAQSRQGAKTLSLPVSADGHQKPADRARGAPMRCFPMRAGTQLTEEEMAAADEHIFSVYGGDVNAYAANNTVQPLNQEEFQWARSAFKLKADSMAAPKLCKECGEDDPPYCPGGNCIGCCEMCLYTCCEPAANRYVVPSIYMPGNAFLSLEGNNCIVVEPLHRQITAERRTFSGAQGWVIEVSLPSAKYAMVAMQQDHTVAQLKAVVAKHGSAVRPGTKVTDIRIKRNGQDLSNALTLQQAGLRDNAKVVLILRIIGGGKSNESTVDIPEVAATPAVCQVSGTSVVTPIPPASPAIDAHMEQQVMRSRTCLACPGMPSPSPPPPVLTPSGTPTDMMVFNLPPAPAAHMPTIASLPRLLGNELKRANTSRQIQQDGIFKILQSKRPCEGPQEFTSVNEFDAANRTNAMQYVMAAGESRTLHALQSDDEIIKMCRPSNPRTPPPSPAKQAPTTPPASPVQTNSTAPQAAFQHWETPQSPSYHTSDPASSPDPLHAAGFTHVLPQSTVQPSQVPDPYAPIYPKQKIKTAYGDLLTDTIIRQAIFEQLNGKKLRECTMTRRDLRQAAELDLEVDLGHKKTVVRAALNDYCKIYNAANSHIRNEVVLTVQEESEETSRAFTVLSTLKRAFAGPEEPAPGAALEEELCGLTESRDALHDRIKFTREAAKANTKQHEDMCARRQHSIEVQHGLDMQQWQQREENTAYAHNMQVQGLEHKLQEQAREIAQHREEAQLNRIKAEAAQQQLHEAEIAAYRVPSPPPQRILIDMRTINSQTVKIPRNPRDPRTRGPADFFGESATGCANNFVKSGWIPRQLRLTGRGAGMAPDNKRKSGMSAAGRNSVQDAPEVQGSNGANHRGDHPCSRWLEYVAGTAEKPRTWVPETSIEVAIYNAHHWRMLVEASKRPHAEVLPSDELLVYEMQMRDTAAEVIKIAFKTVGAAEHLANVQQTLVQVRRQHDVKLSRDQKSIKTSRRLELINEIESIERWMRPNQRTAKRGVERLEDAAAGETDSCLRTGVQIGSTKTLHLCDSLCTKPESEKVAESHVPENDDSGQGKGGVDDDGYESNDSLESYDSLPSLESLTDSGHETPGTDHAQTQSLLHQMSSMAIANAMAANVSMTELTLKEQEIRIKAINKARQNDNLWKAKIAMDFSNQNKLGTTTDSMVVFSSAGVDTWAGAYDHWLSEDILQFCEICEHPLAADNTMHVCNAATTGVQNRTNVWN